MILAEFQQQKKCPDSLPLSLQALWYDKQGQWNKAHEIVAEANDPDSAWIHAYLHRKEGDLNNARYWYKRGDRPESQVSLDQEWEEIASSILIKVNQ